MGEVLRRFTDGWRLLLLLVGGVGTVSFGGSESSENIPMSGRCRSMATSSLAKSEPDVDMLQSPVTTVGFIGEMIGGTSVSIGNVGVPSGVSPNGMESDSNELSGTGNFIGDQFSADSVSNMLVAAGGDDSEGGVDGSTGSGVREGGVSRAFTLESSSVLPSSCSVQAGDKSITPSP